MLRAFGVVGLWIALIAAPHVRSSALYLNAWGGTPQPAATAPADDPGDPYKKQAQPSAPAQQPGSFATIHFKNQMGKAVSLVEVLFTFDGKPLPTLEGLQPDQDTVVYSGRLSPGMHMMRTEMHVQGTKRAGFITYMQGYRFKVTSEQVLTVPDNKSVVYTIAATRNKGMNVPFDKQIDFKVTSEETPPATSSLTN